ncbi:pYEATS domain-containing protein [Paucibacter sp. R3-3]|uniref:PYEATS domain-containing protein n=1 Tax=Roseateles agri TaxID=3098619 RepID=A0ABU5DS50_9BURK|nr:pYEATS domain-containing protein [Paucibacter sp. R3-3]MDY0749150.1 pYEATS domain-containing protein [Paucibacter sp. R3-3]
MPELFKIKTKTGFAFLVISALIVVGFLLLTVQSVSQASWRYLFIGGMTAIAGLGCGGLVGLIFGLPESTPVVVSPQPKSDATAASPPASEDWYRDSSSLERIATWLTGAIIALSLANFESWTVRFDRAAVSIGMAMEGTSSADLAAASIRAAKAQATLDAVKIAPSESGEAYDKRRAAAAEALKDAQAEVARAASAAEVVGGLLLGGYAFLGFAASYLWTRRYLPAELAKARRDMRQESRLDAKDAAELAEARAKNLTQEFSKRTGDPKAAAAAAAAAASSLMTEKLAEGDEARGARPFIQPGPIQNDPWKGQFGGLPSTEHAEVAATIREVRGRPGVFLVALMICARNAMGRSTLAGTEVRLYLHPTFPEPIIRPFTFDSGGVIEVNLAAVGAFTIGVQLMSSGALLELDLADLRDAPAAFRLN